MSAKSSTRTPESLRDTDDIPAEVLEVCRHTAYQLYRNRHYHQAEAVCRGLVAADHLDWYHHSLLAATLQKQGRFSEALAQVDQGLRTLKVEPRLLRLRAAIVKSAAETATRLGDRLPDVHRPPAGARPPALPAQTTVVDPTAERRRHYHQMLTVVTSLTQDRQVLRQGRSERMRA